jgi:hypothetical protein
MKPKKSVKKAWVLVDLDAPKKYIDPGMCYVARSYGGMFSHTNTNDVLEAIHFSSYKEATKYLDEHKNGIFGPNTTFPREVTITASISV